MAEVGRRWVRKWRRRQRGGIARTAQALPAVGEGHGTRTRRVRRSLLRSASVLRLLLRTRSSRPSQCTTCHSQLPGVRLARRHVQHRGQALRKICRGKLTTSTRAPGSTILEKVIICALRADRNENQSA